MITSEHRRRTMTDDDVLRLRAYASVCVSVVLLESTDLSTPARRRTDALPTGDDISPAPPSTSRGTARRDRHAVGSSSHYRRPDDAAAAAAAVGWAATGRVPTEYGHSCYAVPGHAEMNGITEQRHANQTDRRASRRTEGWGSVDTPAPLASHTVATRRNPITRTNPTGESTGEPDSPRRWPASSSPLHNVASIIEKKKQQRAAGAIELPTTHSHKERRDHLTNEPRDCPLSTVSTILSSKSFIVPGSHNSSASPPRSFIL